MATDANEWQPSAYWSSTSRAATTGSSWFSSFVGSNDPGPATSKGVARSSERFGTVAVGLPTAYPAIEEPAVPNLRFSGYSATPSQIDSVPPQVLRQPDNVAQPAPPPLPPPRGADSTLLAPRMGPTHNEADKMQRARTPAYNSLAGCDDSVRAARELIELPIKHPEFFRAAGCSLPGGVLVYGPTGVGKTRLVYAAAAAAGAALVVLNGSEIVGEQSSATKDLRSAFKRAREKAPCVLFLDEIDALAPKSSAASSGSKMNSGDVRQLSQLLALLDESARWRDVDRVVIVAATNRPQALDPSLRRAGRLDNEIVVGMPSHDSRAAILKLLFSYMRVAPDISMHGLAGRTHGFTGADLAGMCDAAGVACLHEHLASNDTTQISVTTLDGRTRDGCAACADPIIQGRHFEQAAAELGPAGMREMRVESPTVRWEDIGGLDTIKLQLQHAIVWPLKFPIRFAHFGAAVSRGVLLYGPPGCGKTLLAKAVATECHANFIAIQASDLLTKFVGESEANVRELFDKARSVKPCVIFMDEIDAIATSRSSGLSADSNAGACDGVVSSLLSELDVAQSGIIVIGATNRPDKIDAALLRPGRLGTLCHVAIPGVQQRMAVLQASLRKAPMDATVKANLDKIADATEGFSCADLNAVCQRAVKIAVKAAVEKETEDGIACQPLPLSLPHMERAMRNARSSVSVEDAEWFRLVNEAIESGRAIPKQEARRYDDDVPKLQQQVHDLVDQVKDAARWQRAWAMAKESSVGWIVKS